MQRNSAGVEVEPWQQAKTQPQEERRAVRHCLHETPVVRTNGMGLARGGKETRREVRVENQWRLRS